MTATRGIPRRILVPARLYVGLVFAAAGIEQLLADSQWAAPGQSWPAALAARLTRYSAHSAWWYHGFLTDWVMPHVNAIAALVPTVEILVGVLLILGVATPWVAGVAIFYLANILAANGQNPIFESHPAAFASLALALCLGRAGLVAGVDGWRAMRSGASAEGTRMMPSWVVVPLRIYVGSALLDPGNFKMGANWAGWVGWMPGFIAGQLPNATKLYQPFLTHVVIPHAAAFAGFVAVAEIVVGAACVLGIATRLFGTLGFMLTANYFLLNGQSIWGVSNDLALAVGFATVAMAGAGRTFGVDAWLSKKWPRVWLW